MNWGGFAAGLSQGFNNGLVIGGKVRDAMKEHRLQKIREQGLAEAQQARQQAIADAVKDNGEPSGAPSTTGAGGANAPAAAVTDAATPAPAAQSGGANPAAPTATVPDASATPSPAPTLPPTATVPDASAVPSAAPSSAPSAAASASQSAAPAPSADGAGGGDGGDGAAPATDSGGPAAPAASGLPKRFTVGGKGFDTREEAAAYAQKNAPSTLDFFMKTAAPKIQEEYVNQGDMEKAAAWEKWTKDRANQKHMETWASAYRAAQMGDYETAANHVFDLYKNYEDGITPMSKEVVKDKDGNVTGFNVRLKNDATGEETTTFIDNDKLVNMGLSALSPPQMFEAAYKSQQERAKTQQQVKLKQLEIGAEDRRMVYKEDRADKREVIKGTNQAARDDRRSDREAENILLKADVENRFKRTTDPQERRAIIVTELSKNPLFARKSEAELAAEADKYMRAAGYPVAPPAAPAPANPAPGAAPGPTASQAAGGLPQAKPNAVPQYVREKATGRIFQVNPDGTRTLVKDAQDANGKPLAN